VVRCGIIDVSLGYRKTARCQRKVRKKFETAIRQEHKSKMFQRKAIYKRETGCRYKKKAW
jgi:hypothetical protein